MNQVSFTDQLSIPFGVIIGPFTIASNTLKLIKDVVARFIALISLVWNKDFYPRNGKNLFADKMAFLTGPGFKEIYGIDLKDATDSDSGDEIDLDSNDENNEHIEQTFHQHWKLLSKPIKENLVDHANAYNQAGKRISRDLTYIGVGFIRTLPFIGGIARCLYIKNNHIKNEIKKERERLDHDHHEQYWNNQFSNEAQSND